MTCSPTCVSVVFNLEDQVPDHSVVCRFRKALRHKQGPGMCYWRKSIGQLAARGVWVKQGTMTISSVGLVG